MSMSKSSSNPRRLPRANSDLLIDPSQRIEKQYDLIVPEKMEKIYEESSLVDKSSCDVVQSEMSSESGQKIEEDLGENITEGENLSDETRNPESEISEEVQMVSRVINSTANIAITSSKKRDTTST